MTRQTVGMEGLEKMLQQASNLPAVHRRPSGWTRDRSDIDTADRPMQYEVTCTMRWSVTGKDPRWAGSKLWRTTLQT